MNPMHAIDSRSHGPLELTCESHDEQRIEELEELLDKHWRILLEKDTDLRALRVEGVRFLRFCSRVRDRYLPPGSFRRRCYRAAPRGCARWLLALGTRHARRPNSINTGYAEWIAAHEPGRAELDRQRQNNPPTGPLISVLVSLADESAPALGPLLASVREQTATRWGVPRTSGQQARTHDDPTG